MFSREMVTGFFWVRKEGEGKRNEERREECGNLVELRDQSTK
jgi:hypothetical protein